ncbi:unnamed protein product [Phytophthora fragariaefolia]|uniref:Unnamed protein product n=1 Tax=Phytophthora fragariaefolia TaxID=1490495 RepID=A0A9W6Y6N6_9STRA|nr:unnamed protein product [Phytophthora fragariaefolia]
MSAGTTISYDTISRPSSQSRDQLVLQVENVALSGRLLTIKIFEVQNAITSRAAGTLSSSLRPTQLPSSPLTPSRTAGFRVAARDDVENEYSLFVSRQKAEFLYRAAYPDEAAAADVITLEAMANGILGHLNIIGNRQRDVGKLVCREPEPHIEKKARVLPVSTPPDKQRNPHLLSKRQDQRAVRVQKTSKRTMEAVAKAMRRLDHETNADDESTGNEAESGKMDRKNSEGSILHRMAVADSKTIWKSELETNYEESDYISPLFEAGKEIEVYKTQPYSLAPGLSPVKRALPERKTKHKDLEERRQKGRQLRIRATQTVHESPQSALSSLQTHNSYKVVVEETEYDLSGEGSRRSSMVTVSSTEKTTPQQRASSAPRSSVVVGNAYALKNLPNDTLEPEQFLRRRTFDAHKSVLRKDHWQDDIPGMGIEITNERPTLQTPPTGLDALFGTARRVMMVASLQRNLSESTAPPEQSKIITSQLQNLHSLGVSFSAPILHSPKLESHQSYDSVRVEVASHTTGVEERTATCEVDVSNCPKSGTESTNDLRSSGQLLLNYSPNMKDEPSSDSCSISVGPKSSENPTHKESRVQALQLSLLDKVFLQPTGAQTVFEERREYRLKQRSSSVGSEGILRLVSLSNTVKPPVQNFLALSRPEVVMPAEVVPNPKTSEDKASIREPEAVVCVADPEVVLYSCNESTTEMVEEITGDHRSGGGDELPQTTTLNFSNDKKEFPVAANVILPILGAIKTHGAKEEKYETESEQNLHLVCWEGSSSYKCCQEQLSTTLNELPEGSIEGCSGCSSSSEANSLEPNDSTIVPGPVRNEVLAPFVDNASTQPQGVCTEEADSEGQHKRLSTLRENGIPIQASGDSEQRFQAEEETPSHTCESDSENAVEESVVFEEIPRLHSVPYDCFSCDNDAKLATAVLDNDSLKSKNEMGSREEYSDHVNTINEIQCATVSTNSLTNEGSYPLAGGNESPIGYDPIENFVKQPCRPLHGNMGNVIIAHQDIIEQQANRNDDTNQTHHLSIAESPTLESYSTTKMASSVQSLDHPKGVSRKASLAPGKKAGSTSPIEKPKVNSKVFRRSTVAQVLETPSAAQPTPKLERRHTAEDVKRRNRSRDVRRMSTIESNDLPGLDPAVTVTMPKKDAAKEKSSGSVLRSKNKFLVPSKRHSSQNTVVVQTVSNYHKKWGKWIAGRNIIEKVGCLQLEELVMADPRNEDNLLKLGLRYARWSGTSMSGILLLEHAALLHKNATSTQDYWFWLGSAHLDIFMRHRKYLPVARFHLSKSLRAFTSAFAYMGSLADPILLLRYAIGLFWHRGDGNLEKTRDIFHELFSQFVSFCDKDRPNLLFLQFQVLHRLKLYVDAIDCMNKIITLHENIPHQPREVETPCLASTNAMTHFELYNATDYRLMLMQCQQASGDYVSAAQNLGSVLKLKGMQQETTLKDDEYFDLWCSLAEKCFHHEDYALALEYYAIALNFAKQSQVLAAIHYKLGLCFQSLGEDAKCITEYKRARTANRHVPPLVSLTELCTPYDERFVQLLQKTVVQTIEEVRVELYGRAVRRLQRVFRQSRRNLNINLDSNGSDNPQAKMPSLPKRSLSIALTRNPPTLIKIEDTAEESDACEEENVPSKVVSIDDRHGEDVTLEVIERRHESFLVRKQRALEEMAELLTNPLYRGRKSSPKSRPRARLKAGTQFRSGMLLPQKDRLDVRRKQSIETFRQVCQSY